MNREELRREIERLEEEMRRARRNGFESELEILRQRINLAKSYLTDPNQIRPGAKYEVEGSDKPFFVEYLRGGHGLGALGGRCGTRRPSDRHLETLGAGGLRGKKR